MSLLRRLRQHAGTFHGWCEFRVDDDELRAGEEDAADRQVGDGDSGDWAMPIRSPCMKPKKVSTAAGAGEARRLS